MGRAARAHGILTNSWRPMRAFPLTLVWLSCASALQLAPVRLSRCSSPTMQLWAGRKRSRYDDDGSRLEGADSIGSVDAKLKGGWFSDFKWGTEVEVVGTETKGKKKAKKSSRGMAADNSDRGLGGNQAYRNTESARFSGLETQQIRKRNLEAYINSEEEASDGTFGKIISGSALVSIFGGLLGVYFYYGGDSIAGLISK